MSNSGEFDAELPGVAEELKNGSNLATLEPLKIRRLEDSNNAQLSAYKPGYEPEVAKNALEIAGVFQSA